MLNRAVLLLLFFPACIAFAQDFRLPMDIPLQLAGNFGELRSNHFHTGIDIRTNGQIGQKVYAIEDGEVRRINVSPWGYGKAIYIDHPNGMTSVYAHLDRFEGEVAAVLGRIQYELKSFKTDTTFPAGVLKVKKGEQIAWSGNSGSSGGPHLHFELRNTATEHPVNPLKFFNYPDDVKPLPQAIRIHPVDGAVINGKNETLQVDLTGSGAEFTIPDVRVNGNVTLSIKTLDKANLPGYTLGLYEMRMTADARPMFTIRFDSLDFTTNRAINAYTDYEHHCSSKEKFQRLWKLSHNPLTNIQAINRGILTPGRDSITRVEIFMRDYAGNSSVLKFNLINDTTVPQIVQEEKPQQFPIIRAGTYGMFHDRDIWVQFPEATLYSDQQISYLPLDTFPDGVVRTHSLHDACVPVHKPFHISVMIPARLEGSKNLVLARKTGKSISNVYTGTRKGRFFHTEANGFGDFYLLEDREEPKITPVSLRGEPVFTIKDNLSGISHYDFYINNKWELLEYDGKNARLSGTFKNYAPGNYSYRLEVFDNSGNKAVQEGTIIF